MIVRYAVTAAPVLPAVLLAALLAGCGGQAEGGAAPSAATASASASSHVMPDGSVMGGSEMDMSHSASASPSASPSGQAATGEDDYGGMSRDYSAQDADGDGVIDGVGVDGQASETATMVCADQVRDAVKRTFRVRGDLEGTPTWDGHTYTCTYDIDGAPLVASVRDDTSDSATTGRGWFRLLKRQLPGAHRLKGLIGLGFPSYASKAGHVVFLKDHKTLHVDSSQLPASALPKDFSRQDVAYAVASTVMVCWTD